MRSTSLSQPPSSPSFSLIFIPAAEWRGGETIIKRRIAQPLQGEQKGKRVSILQQRGRKMSSVIFKAQLISECSSGGDPSSGGGGGDGVFRMGWFSVSGKGASVDQRPPSPTDYQYIRGRLSYILCLPKNQDFDVCYRGADGKSIVIDQDEELRKAVSQLDDGLCKVYVCLKGPNMACG